MKHQLRLLSPLIASAAILWGAGPVFAQDAPSDPVQTDEELPEFVVTGDTPIKYHTENAGVALFGDTPIIETPFSIAVITEDLIEDRRAFSAAEALQYEPSVSASQGFGFYNRQDFAVRGFNTGFEGHFVDGLPITKQGEPALDDKQRIEVLKGPAGLRFGFSPPGGAINYVRKRPTPGPYTSIATDVNTFGSFYGQIDTSNTFQLGDPVQVVPSGKNPVVDKNPVFVDDGPTLGYRFVAAGDVFDSYYNNAGGDRLFGSAMVEYKSDDVTLWTSISGQNFERNGYGGVLVGPNGEIFDTGVETNNMQPWAHNQQDFFEVATGIEVDLAEGWKLSSTTNYGQTDRSGHQSWFGAWLDPAAGDFYDVEWLIGTQEIDYWGNFTWLEGEIETGPLVHDFVIGGQYKSQSYYRPTTRSSNILGINNIYSPVYLPEVGSDGLDRVNNYNYDEYALFATDTIEFTDWLSLLVGGRYATLRTTDPYEESVFSPTAALMIEPVKNIHTYVSYTEGIQQGGSAPAIAINAFENMPPLESTQIEAGIKAELVEGRLYGEIAAFQIEQSLEYLDSNFRYVQDGKRVHEGIEFALRGRLSETVNAGVAAMFLDPVQEDTGDPFLNGKMPANTPNYRATAYVDVDIPAIPGLTLSANAIFNDRVYADSFEQFSLDSYVILNAGARYKFQMGDQDWTLRAYLQNLTDERYYGTGSFSSGFGGQLEYGAPLSATFSVQVEF